MGQRGPVRRPEYLKVLSGTVRADRPPEVAAIPQDQVMTELPPPPEWMPNEIAKQEWANIGGELLKRGLLAVDRLMTLGIYCATSGKIAQKYQAGDIPTAHMLSQFTKLGKELGIIGNTTKQQQPEKATASTSRLASIKERANRTD